MSMSDGYLISTDGGLDLCDFVVDPIPKVGEKVFIVSVSQKQIWALEVYAIGKESFFVKEISYGQPFFTEYRFDEYGKEWFGILDDAKEYVESYLTDDEELVEDEDGCYAERI
jgi:hypothetical protein